MITKQQILDTIETQLESDGYFVVDVDVKSSKRIVVLIDSDQGVPIEYCVSISRLVREAIGESLDDYDLEVSSPGIGQPLKVFRQFLKCIDRDVEVILNDGMKYRGVLSSATEEEIVIQEEKKVKIPGRKKREIEIVEHNFSFDNIKSVKETIKF